MIGVYCALLGVWGPIYRWWFYRVEFRCFWFPIIRFAIWSTPAEYKQAAKIRASQGIHEMQKRFGYHIEG